MSKKKPNSRELLAAAESLPNHPDFLALKPGEYRPRGKREVTLERAATEWLKEHAEPKRPKNPGLKSRSAERHHVEYEAKRAKPYTTLQRSRSAGQASNYPGRINSQRSKAGV